MNSTTLGAAAANPREQFQSLMRAVGMLPVLILLMIGFGLIAGGGIADESSWLELRAVVPVFAAGWLLRTGRLHREAPAAAQVTSV